MFVGCLLFLTTAEGVLEGASEDAVAVSLSSSVDSVAVVESEDDPPPNKPLSLPVQHKSQLLIEYITIYEGHYLPAMDSGSLMSAYTCASLTATKPLSESDTITFTTGSVPPISVIF
jgi:hypothetical protein